MLPITCLVGRAKMETKLVKWEPPTSGQQEIIQAVLDGLTSEHSKRAYERSLRDFLAWHETQGRPAISRAMVQRYAAELKEGGMSAANINQRLSAIRKLASEASDNGVLDAQIANGILKVKGVRQGGTRAGNWLGRDQAQALLESPNIEGLKGMRDRALLALLLGCGLRRTEAASLTLEHIQQRDSRWIIVDLVGKRNKVRSVPMPNWAKKAIDSWTTAAGIDSGLVFRPINKGGHLSGDSMTDQAIRNVVTEYGVALGFAVAPHDLRRTFAKLAYKGGSGLDQIQLSLGHGSIQTTEKYLGVEQDLSSAPCDHLGLRL
jgi:integrase/recombinase XerD